MKLSRDQIEVFRSKVREVILQAQERGLPIPESIKRRDRREPSADEKELLEDKFTRAIKRHWKKQRSKLEQMIQVYYNYREKSIIPPGIDDLLDEEDDEFEAAFIRLLLYGSTRGVELFSQNVPLDIDWTMVNTRAAKWAKKKAGELIKYIDGNTRDIVRQALTDFIQTPGMTIGDLVDRLPFTETRARSVAVTETTRSYAQGQIITGEE